MGAQPTLNPEDKDFKRLALFAFPVVLQSLCFLSFQKFSRKDAERKFSRVMYSETHYCYLLRKSVGVWLVFFVLFLNLIGIYKHEWKCMNRAAIKTDKCH